MTIPTLVASANYIILSYWFGLIYNQLTSINWLIHLWANTIVLVHVILLSLAHFTPHLSRINTRTVSYLTLPWEEPSTYEAFSGSWCTTITKLYNLYLAFVPTTATFQGRIFCLKSDDCTFKRIDTFKFYSWHTHFDWLHLLIFFSFHYVLGNYDISCFWQDWDMSTYL